MRSTCRLMCAAKSCCWKLRLLRRTRCGSWPASRTDHAGHIACVTEWLRSHGDLSRSGLAGDTVPGMDADCDDDLPATVRAPRTGAGALCHHGSVSLISCQSWCVAPVQL